MIIVKLEGQLGHQLCSYAAGLALSKYHKTDLFVDNELVFYQNFDYYLDKLELNPAICKNSLPTIRERKNYRFQFNLNFFKMNNVCIRGCWQHPCYTNNIISIIRSKIKVTKNEYTSIHIRRNDNLRPERSNLVPTMEWINKAMSLLPGPYCVVTDDIEWSKENIKADKYKSDSPISDFKFLAGSENVITSASSFSWWAARLSEGKVVGPKNWVPNGWNWNEEKHICCKHWIVL